MNITTYTEFEQNTDLWLLARLGLPTASCFKTVLAKGTGVGTRSQTRQRLISRLTAELMRCKPTETYTNPYMERGHLLEADALAAYLLQTKHRVDKVAFVRNHELNIGCSPDGLVGSDGGVEVKTMIPELFVDLLCEPGIPSEHIPQVQGSMLVTGRQWWDVAIYSPGFDEVYVETVGRENGYLDELKRYLVVFQEELEAKVLKATKGDRTFIACRKQCDAYFQERLAEELDDFPATGNCGELATMRVER